MFNSNILDVAVGLIFVYLLLSLMCTTVNEWIAQFFNTRAATLKEGIRRLLHAPPDGVYFIRPVDINVVAMVKRLKQPADKLTVALGTFEPEVQSLIDGFAAAIAAGPSIPPADLAPALAAKLNSLLNEPGLDRKIDISKVTPETKAALAKPLRGGDLLRLNHTLLGEAYPDEIRSLSDAFYSHPLIKALARPGEHPSYVPANTFALTMIDILNKGIALGGSSEEKATQIKAAIDNLPDSDVKKSLQSLVKSTVTSADGVEKVLETWFNDSMDRISGWYKNKVQVWTVIVACVITIFANADTIQIARNLMLNPVLRDAIVAQAKTAPAPGASTLTAQQKADLSGLTGWGWEFRHFHRLLACANPAMRNPGQSEADCKNQKHLPSGPNANPALVAAWEDDSFPGTDLFSMVLFPWLWMIVPGHLVGWFFTAIAASLGAPFWFDTLNKFMNVRAAGTSPDEKGKDKSKL